MGASQAMLQTFLYLRVQMTANISWSQNGEATILPRIVSDILRFDSHTLLGFFLPI